MSSWNIKAFHDWCHKKEKWKFLTFIDNLTRVIWANQGLDKGVSGSLTGQKN